MFLHGPFSQFPFVENALLGSHMACVGVSVVSFAGTTNWDRMLAADETPIAYFTDIEPWVLADRS